MNRTPFNILIVIISILLAAGGAFGADKETKPILRIETGRHTAIITSLDSDANGHYLVTSSEDKTVRLWDAVTGKLIKTLRPFIGKNPEEGVVVSVAISPDGSTIACAYVAEPVSLPVDYRHPEGKQQLHRTFTIAVYNTKTWENKIIAKKELVQPILKFTRKGKYLLSTGQIGIIVYKTSDWSEHGLGMLDYYNIASDTIGDDHFAILDSSRTVSIFKIIDHKKLPQKIKDISIEDNYGIELRFKTGNIKRVATHQLPKSKVNPASITVSPDGQRFAVGYQKDSKVIVGNISKNKSFIELDVRNAHDFNLNIKDKFAVVAWSLDGKYIYGGIITNTPRYLSSPAIVRRWNLSKKPVSYEDTTTGMHESVNAIAPTAHDGIAFVTGSYIGLVSKNGGLSLLSPFLAHSKQRRPVPNDSGSIFNFYFQKKLDELYGDAYVFDVQTRSIAPWTDKIKLDDSPQSVPGMELSPYGTGILNGVKLDLFGGIEAWAFSFDGDSCVVASRGWQLLRYDRGANVVWSIRTPDVVTGLAVTKDGKLVIASLADGSFRWYNHADGQELLAFFPLNDRKRWVLWTPSGYYDASPQGDELIGWYFKDEKDKSGNFYPASRFKSLYYRPDIISKVLETLSESQAIIAANSDSGRKPEQALAIPSMLPPSVSILSPLSGSGFTSSGVTVRYKISSRSGEPITNVKVLIDGRPVASNRGVKIVEKDDSEQVISVNLTSKDCEISIIAENRYSSSEPAIIQLKWVGKNIDAFVIKPKMYLLAVGVSEYRQSDLKLKYAAKDAQDFAKVMNGQRGGLYRDVVSRVLVNGAATKDSILDGLEWVQKETTSNDVAVIFIAGHGVNDSNGTYYFLPENAESDKLTRTGVSLADLKQTISSLAGKVLLFVDTCHSGNIFGGRRTVVDINAIVNDLSSAENGAVVFASSTGRQYSIEKDEWANGAFTKALIEGLNGGADYTKKGSITVNMLDLFVSERVKELSGGKQTPATAKPSSIPDFPIVIKPL